MSMKLDSSQAAAKIAKLRAIRQKLPQMAGEAQQQALGMLIIGARVNIYGTAPGAYQRTQDYLRSLNATAHATGSGVTVTVSSTSEYAAAIEFGHEQVSAPMLQAMALAQNNMNAPLSLGRSGKQWWVSGPVLISGQVFAGRLLRELFRREVAEAME